MIFRKNRLGVHLWTLGMKQRTLSDLTGLSEATISNAIHRGQATRRSQEKIAQALNVAADELFPDEPND